METELDKTAYKILTAGSLGSIILFVLGILFRMLPVLNGQEIIGYSVTVNLGGREVSGSSLLFLAGSLILLATPFTVTIASAIIYLTNREYKFAAVTLLVALIMVSSLILGISGLLCPST